MIENWCIDGYISIGTVEQIPTVSKARYLKVGTSEFIKHKTILASLTLPRKEQDSVPQGPESKGYHSLFFFLSFPHILLACLLGDTNSY